MKRMSWLFCFFILFLNVSYSQTIIQWKDTVIAGKHYTTPVKARKILKSNIFDNTGGSESSVFVPSPDEYVCGIQYRTLNTKPYFADTAIQMALDNAIADGIKRVRLTSSIPDVTGYYIILKGAVDIYGPEDTIKTGFRNYGGGEYYDAICAITVKAINPLGNALQISNNGPYGRSSVIKIKADYVGSNILHVCGTVYADVDLLDVGALETSGGTLYANVRRINAREGSYCAYCIMGTQYSATQYIHCDTATGNEPMDGPFRAALGGVQYLSIGVAVNVSPTGYVLASYDGGIQYVNGGRFIHNNASTAYGVAYVASGGVMQLQNCILINKTVTAPSVYSPDAQNVYILGTVVANTAVGSNITQKVGTITVSTDIPNP